jgi:lipopolysaccharide transport system ATP-binding protein
LWKRAIGAARGHAIVRGEATEEFWALKDVSFEVQRGTVLGIVGRNGAGKSTLLKILSRITEPSKGRVIMKGRTSSLLEVGTGFHPELTGRENIYLNGAVLGMSRAEIRRKFDEIVDFAGVEKFIDTPVKHYSSGMQVRLAFAVAAHLEPEILVVDEVLAVGDAEFQKKCFGRMRDVSNSGTTILLVSHNMAAVRAFCNRAILFHSGEVVAQGDANEIIARYLESIEEGSSTHLFTESSRLASRFESIKMINSSCSFGEMIELEIEIGSSIDTVAAIEFEIHDQLGSPVAYASTAPMHSDTFTLSSGMRKRLKMTIGPLALASGTYALYFCLTRPWFEYYHVIPTPIMFRINTSDPGGTGFEFKQSHGRGAFTVPLAVMADA